MSLSSINSPVASRRIHAALTFFWLGAAAPILIWFPESIPVIVFISIYANVVGHWSAYQAARTEVKQDEQQ